MVRFTMKRGKVKAEKKLMREDIIEMDPAPRTLQIPPIVERTDVTRHDIIGSDGTAFFLRSLLSPSECRFFIAQSEAMGMQDCGYSPSIRRTDRVSTVSEPVAAWLFKRLRNFIEPCIDLSVPTDKTWPSGVPRSYCSWPQGIPKSFRPGLWSAFGLNEMIRVCRYEPGGFFRPHFDGGFSPSEHECSIKSVMIYLNDEFDGGATNFYDETQEHYCQGDPNKITYSFKPKMGDCLIFNSFITHEGGEVRRGRKYIMRSEIMYSCIEPAKV